MRAKYLCHNEQQTSKTMLEISLKMVNDSRLKPIKTLKWKI